MLDQASTIDNVQEDFTLRRERLIVQYNDDLARANAAYEEGGYRKAREAAVTARIRIDRCSSPSHLQVGRRVAVRRRPLCAC